MPRDHRDDQRCKDWWGEKIELMGGMTRNDLAWVAVGFIIAVIALRFPVNWDWVFGLR